MAWPSLAARTKDWGTETLTDSDLEGQFDLIITYINDMMDSSTGHKHDATTAEGPKILINNLTIASRAQGDTYYDNGTNPTRLAAGTAGQALTTGGAAANPAWAGMTTQGDVEYHNGTTRTRLAAGTAGQFLKTGGAAANPSWVSGGYIAVGTYTGNATDDRNITIGFADTSITPKFVMIKSATTRRAYFRTSSHGAGNASFFDANADATDLIQAFSANTFQIGASAEINTNLEVYWFMALG